jgi:hypothetical protein
MTGVTEEARFCRRPYIEEAYSLSRGHSTRPRRGERGPVSSGFPAGWWSSWCREQAQPLLPSALGGVAVFQGDSLRWDRFAVAPAGGGDSEERARARAGLDLLPQRGLDIRRRVGDGHDDVAVVRQCQHGLIRSLPRNVAAGVCRRACGCSARSAQRPQPHRQDFRWVTVSGRRWWLSRSSPDKTRTAGVYEFLVDDEPGYFRARRYGLAQVHGERARGHVRHRRPEPHPGHVLLQGSQDQARRGQRHPGLGGR